MEQSLAPESISFEQSLYSLIQADQITREDALQAADSQNNLLWFINNAGKPMAQPDRQLRKDSPSDASFSEFTLNI
jgi:twitching motility protein PilU